MVKIEFNITKKMSNISITKKLEYLSDYDRQRIVGKIDELFEKTQQKKIKKCIVVNCGGLGIFRCDECDHKLNDKRHYQTKEDEFDTYCKKHINQVGKYYYCNNHCYYCNICSNCIGDLCPSNVIGICGKCIKKCDICLNNVLVSNISITDGKNVCKFCAVKMDNK
jgi:hypothetical protein